MNRTTEEPKNLQVVEGLRSPVNTWNSFWLSRCMCSQSTNVTDGQTVRLHSHTRPKIPRFAR